jgi:hypothetical protein
MKGDFSVKFYRAVQTTFEGTPSHSPAKASGDQLAGQAHYSSLAIETALTLRAVFKLALRQCEGLIGSIMRMLAIGLPVPDHSTLSRRACGLPVQSRPRSGAGELHLIVDSTGLKLRGAGESLFEQDEFRNAGPGASFTSASTLTVMKSSLLT